MTGGQLHVIVPGPLEQRTGGSIYDARMVEGLHRLGWSVTVHSLEGTFPMGDALARASLAGVLAGLSRGALVVIDGLAMGGLPDVVGPHRTRLRLLSLLHQLLADEPGLQASRRDQLLELEREALAAACGVIATSAFTAARAERLGIDAGRIRTVTPGTDRAPLAVGPGPDAPPRLLCVAAVTPGKGQDILVSALARIADAPWTCVCAGSLDRAPDFARAVVASAHRAGVSDRIAFVGECDADGVAALYRTSTVFVLPSHYEGYGMALTEAMARGLPIVTTSAGAIPDTVPADGGILVPPGDDAALAEALRLLVADAPGGALSAATRRAKLGAAGRRHASGLPDWDEAAACFAEAVSAMGGAVPARWST